MTNLCTGTMSRLHIEDLWKNGDARNIFERKSEYAGSVLGLAVDALYAGRRGNSSMTGSDGFSTGRIVSVAVVAVRIFAIVSCCTLWKRHRAGLVVHLACRMPAMKPKVCRRKDRGTSLRSKRLKSSFLFAVNAMTVSPSSRRVTSVSPCLREGYRRQSRANRALRSRSPR